MGTAEPFSSLTAQVGNWYVNLIIMSLIVVGGLGFFVWRDILNTRLHFTKMQLHTKLVLTVTAFLIISGSVLLFLFEHGTASFEGLTLSEQIAASSFQSVSARTAGFNTIDLAALTESGRFLIIILMFIGASPDPPPAESRRQRLPCWRFPLSPHSAAENQPKFSGDGWKK